MSAPRFRIFFDTSVYIAALISPKGAAGELVSLAESGAVTMVVSEQVIVESDQVLGRKFPQLIQDSRLLWKCLRPEIVVSPSSKDLKPFLEKLPPADAKILCAACQADVQAFVTWNTKDFMKSGVQTLACCPIVIPGDCLKMFHEWIRPYLD
ncbi:MAG: hypothetical protein COW13_02645 [Candidatus Omnitrophica bacterium CG12_big_fil_rev_8_21_14_0_65_50_5]|nr:MAG: hypothetical protein COW13_02645 [Candidatus Omnitrophica bacterium CG12_big_fil_rev_8_21_14_0_65_50_5]